MSVLRPSGTVLHLFGWDKKFVPSFIDFVIERFAIEDHRFIVHGEVQKEDLPMGRGIVHFGSLLKNLLRLMAENLGTFQSTGRNPTQPLVVCVR